MKALCRVSLQISIVRGFFQIKISENILKYVRLFFLLSLLSPTLTYPFPFQLGGTIGDIEGMPFVEAFRQFQFKAKRENFCNIHVSLVPQVSY